MVATLYKSKNNLGAKMGQNGAKMSDFFDTD